MDKFQTLREKENPANNVYPNIQTQNIPDSGVTTAKIADSAITTVKLSTGSVTTAKIDSNAVTSGKIATGAVTEGKIAIGAVTESKIVDGAVSYIKLANSAVTTAKIANGAVTEMKIANYAVGYGKLYLNEINSVLTDYPTLAEFLTAWQGYDLLHKGKFFMKDSNDCEMEVLVCSNGFRVWIMYIDIINVVPKVDIITNDSEYTTVLGALRLSCVFMK